jgi:DNA-binding NarL/FixJ family response regulator
VSTVALIVEDDAVTRQALATGLREAGLRVTAACASGEEALALAGGLPIDVALVDLGLPGISGAETIRRLRGMRPSLPALVLSVVENPELIVAAFEAGATGYLLKGAPIPEIVNAVNQVREGLAPISPAVARHIVATLHRREQSSARAATRERLTAREQEILSMLVGGHSYAAIGTALAISLSTVQSHVKSIYRKLEVCSKAEAVGVALTEGLVPRGRR